MQIGVRPRWLDILYFVLLLLIITTTLISWFNTCSQLMILMLLVLLVLEWRTVEIRTVFTNQLFLAYFSLAFLEVIGLFYTNNFKEGWHNLESKATLVAIPFILMVGPFRGKENFKKIMTAYCLISFALTFMCLCIAAYRYANTGQAGLFFYHDLVSPLQQNAILSTLLLIAAIIYLLYNNLYFGVAREPGRVWRVLLIIYFAGFCVLLASKLLLFVMPLLLAIWLLQRYPAEKRTRPILALMLAVAVGATILITTDNPIKARYVDILRGDLDLVKREKFSPDIYLNGVQLRLLEYRYAWEILKEHNAWIWGVSPGDAQDLLDEKYRQANLYLGTPDGKDIGFLNYDSHNQFLQQLLQSGIIGLLVLIVVCVMLVARAVKERSRETILFLVPVILVSLTASLLELQHGLFLFTFFPFLFMYNLNNQQKTPVQA
jgi:O-antigen ligase